LGPVHSRACFMDSEDTRSPLHPEKEAWTTVMGRYSLFDPAIVLFKMLSRQPLRVHLSSSGCTHLQSSESRRPGGCCRAAPFDSGALAVGYRPRGVGQNFERGFLRAWSAPLSPSIKIDHGSERHAQCEQTSAARDQYHYPHSALSISTTPGAGNSLTVSKYNEFKPPKAPARGRRR
jgi:hypothetical protein